MEPQLQQQLGTMKVVSGPVGKLEESQLVMKAHDVDTNEINNSNCVVISKRKRGRPTKRKNISKTTTPLLRPKKDEENVCFICFDGGSLVLCDRPGCPKAYHPSCIKRDDTFFHSKAKWTCGWHICRDCGKTSHYKCYTCTYSLCKKCTKDVDYVCVRGNKGLCGMCKKTIMLIENSAQENKAMCDVDFDDKSTWEYLFKVYWMYLKEKLSLTFDEILQAKNPCRGMELPFSNLMNDKPWHYQDPTGKVQGPFSILQLYKWKAYGYFPPHLKIWRMDDKQDNSILLTDVLNVKCSTNMSSPYNNQQLSLGANGTLDNKENSQDHASNVTRNEYCSNSQIVEQSWEQRVDNTCTQSDGMDETVRSNGWHSRSPCWNIQADGKNNEERSENFERKEESLNCEISCHDHTYVNPALHSTVFCENLIENPYDKINEGHRIEGNSKQNVNFDLNRIFEAQSNNGQNYPDNGESFGQSTDQNGRFPNATHLACDIYTWLENFGEPIYFEESISDLLTEVDGMKMESFGGLESPTSIMKYGEELIDDSIPNCLRFANGPSPMHNASKSDELSSTCDLHLPSQSTIAEEPFQQVNVYHHYQRIPGEHTSKSSKVEVDM